MSLLASAVMGSIETQAFFARTFMAWGAGKAGCEVRECNFLQLTAKLSPATSLVERERPIYEPRFASLSRDPGSGFVRTRQLGSPSLRPPTLRPRRLVVGRR